MIRSFRSKSLQRYWMKGETKGLPAGQIDRLNLRLSALDEAVKPEQMDVPGWRFHKLAGKLKGRFSIWVTGNWRLTFGWDGTDAIDVDHEDYH